MDTKKLQALVTVIKHGSLTSAADELGYTQPGLTNMMNSLEEEFGFAVLIRSKTGVRLSPAGQELLPSIRSIIDATDQFDNSVKSIREKSSFSLRVGAYSSIARQWLPDIMQKFLLTEPDIDLSASIQDIKAMYDAVKFEKIDCALVSYSENLLSNLHWTPLADDEFVAVIPKNETSNIPNRYDMKNFHGSVFLMPAGGFDKDITPLFNSASSPESIKYTNMDDETIISMVEHRLGITIMSDLNMKGNTSKVYSIPLEPPAHRKLGIIVKDKRKNERPIRLFIESAQKVISEKQGR